MYSIYNTSKEDIHDIIIDQLSETFDTNETFIEGLWSMEELIIPDDTICDAYTNFTTTTIIPVIEDNTLVIVVSLCSAAGFILFLAIGLAVCYKRHLACFKQEWTVRKDDVDLGLDDPKVIYEGQQDVDKKKGFNTNGTTTGGTGTMHVGEASASNVGRPKRKVHPIMKSQSIRIVQPSTEIDSAVLRAKSISSADNEEVVVRKGEEQMRIRKNVSQRVLPQDKPNGGLNKLGRSVTARDSDSVYVTGISEEVQKHGGFKLSYDYSNRPSNTKDSGYVYNNVSQWSAPDQTPTAPPNISYKFSNHNKPMVQLQSIPNDKPLDPERPQKSKIDDVLNRAKRTNKVIEFTDFDKELKLIKLIGKGSFGKVYKAKYDAEFVAVKLFTNINPIAASQNDITVAATQMSATQKSMSTGSNGLAVENIQLTTIDDEQYKELYAEIVLATSIPPHPNIVRINGFCRKPLCVVMEYMAGGSVQKLVYGLTNKPDPSATEKFVILVKACYGLAKLTEYGLHHRDVAARNILLGEYQTHIDNNTKVKITDFGMTRKDEENDKGVQKTKNETGPYKWMAPESIQKQVYNEKTDVYMFAITMWEIMFGREPYENEDAINAAMHVCMKGERPEFLWDLPSGLKTLIKKCWDKDPDQRPTFKFVAKRLEKLAKSMQSDIEENQEMDQIVEEENIEKEKALAIYHGINRVESGQSGQYDEF